MHLDEKSPKGGLWGRRGELGHEVGVISSESVSSHLPRWGCSCWVPAVQWVPSPSLKACLSLILMSFLLSIFPGLSNRSLIAINHLLKQMSGTMGPDGGGLMKLSGESVWVAGRWVLPLPAQVGWEKPAQRPGQFSENRGSQIKQGLGSEGRQADAEDSTSPPGGQRPPQEKRPGIRVRPADQMGWVSHLRTVLS